MDNRAGAVQEILVTFQITVQITFRFMVFLLFYFASVLVIRLLLLLSSFPLSILSLLLDPLLCAILLVLSFVTFVNAVPLPIGPFDAGYTLARVGPFASSLTRVGARAAVALSRRTSASTFVRSALVTAKPHL